MAGVIGDERGTWFYRWCYLKRAIDGDTLEMVVDGGGKPISIQPKSGNAILLKAGDH